MGSRYLQQQYYNSINGGNYERYEGAADVYEEFYPEYTPSCYSHNPYAPRVLQPNYQEFPCQCEECVHAHFAYYAPPPPHPQYPEALCPEYEVVSEEVAHSEEQSSGVYEEAPTPRELDCAKTEMVSKLDTPTHEHMKYVFIGQLPFTIENGKINWLVRMFGGASKVFAVEPQWKENRETGQLQHKGCAHVLILRSEVESVIRNLHHRLLMSKDTVMFGEPDAVHFWAGKAFDASVRVASKPVTCESSHRQVRK